MRGWQETSIKVEIKTLMIWTHFPPWKPEPPFYLLLSLGGAYVFATIAGIFLEK